MRHSLAVRLLREGVSLKAIGDVLGHRSLESTCLYLRLATEDLREVALDLPDSTTDTCPEVIWNRSRRGGRPDSGEAVRCEIDALFRAVDLRTPTGARPRIHDIRHTFAVHALLRWYHRGVDPQAKLPFLSTCMGHVSPMSTAYYLPFVSALAEAASLRFLRTCGALVTVSPGGQRP